MHVYGYLKKGKNRYPISSRTVTIGGIRDNDIRVLNPDIKPKHAKLDIRPKSSNSADGNDFVLQVFFDGPITVNGKSTPVNEDIFLGDMDEICFANNKFKLQIENLNQNLAEINQNVPAQCKQDVAASKNGPTSYSVYPKFYSSSSKPRRSSGRLSLAKKVPSSNKTPRRSRRFSSLYPVDLQKEMIDVTATTNASYVTAFDETIVTEETDDEMNQNDGTINLDSTPEKTQPDYSQFETPNQTVVNVGDSLSIIEESNGDTKSDRSETIMITSTPCPDMTTYSTPKLVLATKSGISKSSPALLQPGLDTKGNLNKDLIKSALKTPNSSAVILNSVAKSVKFSEFSIQKAIQDETKILVPTKLFDGEFPDDDVPSSSDGPQTPVSTPVFAKKSSARKNFSSRIPVLTPTRTYSRTSVTTPTYTTPASTSKIAKRITPTRVIETKSPTVTPQAACLTNVSELQKLIQSTDEEADLESFPESVSETLVEPKTPIVSEINESMTAKLVEPTTPTDCKSNVNFDSEKLAQSTTPLEDDAANVQAIREMPQATTPKADYQTNVDFGLKKLTQPKTPAADYESNIDYALKKMVHPTPKADYDKNVDFGIKKLTQPVTPSADYESNIGGMKKLTQPTTPKADYETNVDFGVKKMLEFGTPKADYDTNLDWGLKKLIQPGTPEADFDTDLDWGLKKLIQPGTPEADYEKNVDFGLNKMLAPSTPDADYEKNVDFGLRQMFSINQKEPVSGYDANMTGIGKMMHSPNEPPKANYSLNVSTVGLLFAEEEQEQEPSNNSNELENNKDVDTSKTSLLTPSRKKVTEVLSSQKASTPIVKRTNSTTEEQVSSQVNADVMQTPKVSEVACEVIAPKSTRKQRVNKVILELIEQDTPQKALRSSPRSAKKAQANISNQSEVVFTPKSSNKRAQVKLVDKEVVQTVAQQKLEASNDSVLLANLITSDTSTFHEKNDEKNVAEPHLSMLEESVPCPLDVNALVELEPKSDVLHDGEEQKLIDTSTPTGDDFISTTPKSPEKQQPMSENFVSDELCDLEALVSDENFIPNELVQEVEKTDSVPNVDHELLATEVLLSTSIKSVKKGRKSNEFIVTPSKPIDIAEVVVDQTETDSNEQEEFVSTPSKSSAKKQRRSAEFKIELTPLESKKNLTSNECVKKDKELEEEKVDDLAEQVFESPIVTKSAKKNAVKLKASQESEVSATPKSTIKRTARVKAIKADNHEEEVVKSKPIVEDDLLSGDSETKSEEIINEGVAQLQKSVKKRGRVAKAKQQQDIVEQANIEPVEPQKSSRKRGGRTKIVHEEEDIEPEPQIVPKKRTRGRSAAAKEEEDVEIESQTPVKVRGRSRKAAVKVEPPEEEEVLEVKPRRGRRAKVTEEEEDSSVAEPKSAPKARGKRGTAAIHEEEPVKEAAVVPKKTRGRKAVTVVDDEPEIEPETPAKGRGRSRKAAAKVEQPEEEEVLEVKPKRGRRKVASDDLGELVGFDTEETRKKASHDKMVSKFSEQNDNISGTRRTRGRGAAASNLQPKNKNAIDGLLEGVDILDADGEHFMDVIEESKKTVKPKSTTSTRGRRGKNAATTFDQPKSSTTLKRKATTKEASKLNESIESNESNLAKSNSDSSLQSSSNDDAAPPPKKAASKRPTFVLPKVAIPVGVEYKDGMDETPEKANNRVTRSRNRRY